MYYTYVKDERTGFIVPFLLGSVVGGAAIGATRPRPVFVQNPPMPGPPMYGPVPVPMPLPNYGPYPFY